MKLRASYFSVLRGAVNATLAALLLSLPACGRSAGPANWVLQAQGWSLPPALQAYDPPCSAGRGTPRWVIIADGARYSGSDYALLGTGEGTVDLAPLSPGAGGTPYNVQSLKGRHRLAGIPAPFAKALGRGGESLALVRLYVRGGATIDARWVVRGEAEAYGVDLLGEKFRVPDDNIRLVQGRQAVAGLGTGRVGLRMTDASDESRVYYGLRAGFRHHREAAGALASNGFLRLPADDLSKVELPGPRFFGFSGLLGSFRKGAPIGYAFTVPAALLVSVKSLLLAPLSRPAAGARVAAAPSGDRPRMGSAGIKGDLLWISLLPPEASTALWAVPADSVKIAWSNEGGDRVAVARGPGGALLLAPELLDPAEGTRLYFRRDDLPDRFNLVINDLRLLDGTSSGPWVYNMRLRTRVRWNPVRVWRDWKCD